MNRTMKQRNIIKVTESIKFQFKTQNTVDSARNTKSIGKQWWWWWWLRRLNGNKLKLCVLVNRASKWNTKFENHLNLFLSFAVVNGIFARFVFQCSICAADSLIIPFFLARWNTTKYTANTHTHTYICKKKRKKIAPISRLLGCSQQKKKKRRKIIKVTVSLICALCIIYGMFARYHFIRLLWILVLFSFHFIPYDERSFSPSLYFVSFLVACSSLRFLLNSNYVINYNLNSVRAMLTIENAKNNLNTERSTLHTKLYDKLCAHCDNFNNDFVDVAWQSIQNW